MDCGQSEKPRPSREPNWDEASIEQKLERLHSVVRTMEAAVRRLDKLAAQLEFHDHKDGIILTRLTDPFTPDDQLYQRPGPPTGQWF